MSYAFDLLLFPCRAARDRIWEVTFAGWEKVAREPEEGADSAAKIRREYFERKASRPVLELRR